MSRQKVLLADSDALIGMDLRDTLEEAGYRVLGPCATEADALTLLAQETPTFAVLDVELRDGPCIGLAGELRRRGVAFMIHSGRSQHEPIAHVFQGAPWISKPGLPADVLAILEQLSMPATPPCLDGAASVNPLIRKLEKFARLSDADKLLLAQISANPRLVPPHTDLVREGEKSDGVLLVLSGLACRHKLRANGSRQINAYLVPGDLCDLDVALLDEMDHTITTLSRCKVVRIEPEVIADLLTHHPRIARALRKSQLVDEATLREWLMNVGRRSAVERLAHLFCELLLRLRAVGSASENGFDLPLTQVDLADTAGITSVHVSRSLRELRQQGLIELGGGRLTILDYARLRALAEFRANYLHLGDQAAA